MDQAVSLHIVNRAYLTPKDLPRTAQTYLTFYDQRRIQRKFILHPLVGDEPTNDTVGLLPLSDQITIDRA